jgi:hypothetical protein
VVRCFDLTDSANFFDGSADFAAVSRHESLDSRSFPGRKIRVVRMAVFENRG